MPIFFCSAGDDEIFRLPDRIFLAKFPLNKDIDAFAEGRAWKQCVDPRCAASSRLLRNIITSFFRSNVNVAQDSVDEEK